MESYLDQNQIR